MSKCLGPTMACPMFQITTEIGKKILKIGIIILLNEYKIEVFFYALPKNDPKRKFSAGGLPHAGSYDPVQGLCTMENYYKNHFLIKFIFIFTLTEDSWNGVDTNHPVRVDPGDNQGFGFIGEKDDFSPLIFLEKLHNQTGITPEVHKRKNHMKKNEKNPSQYLIHFIRSALQLFAALTLFD